MLFQILAALPIKHLQNKPKEVVVIEFANENSSDAAISMAVKLKTRMLHALQLFWTFENNCRDFGTTHDVVHVSYMHNILIKFCGFKFL